MSAVESKEVESKDSGVGELKDSLELLAYEHIMQGVARRDGVAKASFYIRHTLGFVWSNFVNGNRGAEDLNEELRNHYRKKYFHYRRGGILPEHLESKVIILSEEDRED